MNVQLRYLPVFGRLLIVAIYLISGIGEDCCARNDAGLYRISRIAAAPLVAYLVAVIVEVGGGILLLIGFQARVAALVMAAVLHGCSRAGISYALCGSEPNDSLPEKHRHRRWPAAGRGVWRGQFQPGQSPFYFNRGGAH